MFNTEKITDLDIKYVIDVIYDMTLKKLNPDIVRTVMMNVYLKLYQNPSRQITPELLRKRSLQEFLERLIIVENEKIKNDKFNCNIPNYVPFNQSAIKLTNLKRTEMNFFMTYKM